MTLISRPSIPEVVFERIKSDLVEFAFNFFQDGVSLDVAARTYKIRLKASGLQVLDKATTTNASGRVTFALTNPEKAGLSAADHQFFLVEILAGNIEKTLMSGTLRWSVAVGKATGLQAAADVSVNYITATDELMVALGVVDFGSMSSGQSAAAAAASAELAADLASEVSANAEIVTGSTELILTKTAQAADAAAAAEQHRVLTEQAKQDVLNAITGTFVTSGGYDASTGIATFAETGVTQALTSVAGLPNGSFWDITKPGNQSIAIPPGGSTAGAVDMLAGGKLISTGTKYLYVPPADTGYQKSVEVESLVFNKFDQVFAPKSIIGWKYMAKGRGATGSKQIQPDIVFNVGGITWGGSAVDFAFSCKILTKTNNIEDINNLLINTTETATPGTSSGGQHGTGGAAVTPFNVEYLYTNVKSINTAKTTYVHNFINFDPIDENLVTEIWIYDAKLTIGGVEGTLVGSALFNPNVGDSVTPITQLSPTIAEKSYVDAGLAAKSVVTLGSIVTSRNLYNPAAISTAYLVNATGATVSTGGQALASKLSDFIKVDPDTDYYISGRNVASGSDAVAYYDANKVLINVPPFDDSWQDGPVNGVYRTGPTTEYMRVQTRFNGVGTDDAVQVEKGSVATAFTPYVAQKYVSTVDAVPVVANVAPHLVAVYAAIDAGNYLKGKKSNWLGDSITKGSNGVGEENVYLNKVCERNGMVGRNYGIPGTRLSTDRAGFGDGMCNVTRYGAMDDDADYIIVFGGTNDISAAVPIGTNEDSTNVTFKGALNILCVGLMEKYPTKKIGFITPFNHIAAAGAKPYRDAIIEICGSYAIPVLDAYSQSSIYPLNTIKRTAQMVTTTDYQHINAAAHLQFSYQVEHFLRSL